MLRDSVGSVVKCYGCGAVYDASPERDFIVGGRIATDKHTHHLGDTGMTREQLLELLSECQEERDEWLRMAFGVEG